MQTAIVFVVVQYPARRLLVFRLTGAELRPAAYGGAPTRSYGIARFLLPIVAGAALGVGIGVATAYQDSSGSMFGRDFDALLYGGYGGLVGGAVGTVVGVFLLLTRRDAPRGRQAR